MESRYYLFSGQTLENTKISDRSHALHITDTEWRKIQKHLDRKKDLQELIEKEESNKKYLSDGNKVLTEKWEDTLEKIRKNKDKSRAKTSEEIQEEKLQKFYVMREEQEKLRNDFIQNVKKRMFRTSGICNNLNSAFVEGEVLFEREKQKDFKQFLKKHEDEVDAKFAKKVKDGVLKEIEEKKEAAQKLRDKKKEYGAHLQKVIQENALKERREKEKKILRESQDNIRAVEEMERMKTVEQQEKDMHKRELAEEMERYMKGRSEMQKQLKQEEKEIDEVIEIYREAKHRIDCMKKEKEKELQHESFKRREALATVVGAVEASKIEAEEQQIKAALAERDAIEEAKIKEKAEHNEQMRKERLQDREDYLKRKEAEQKKEAEIKKWEMVNKYKIDEVTKQYDEDRKKQLWNNILKYRQDLLNQMADVEEERKRQEEFECSKSTNIEEQDAQFYEYADEIMEYAKKKGRSTYPVEKAVLEYKKINNIVLEDLKCGKNEKVEKSLSKELIKKSIKGRPCKCPIRKK